VESSPAIGDVDGDGKIEIVVGSNDGKVYCIIGGGPIWSQPGPWPCFGGCNMHSSNAIDSDIDGIPNRLELTIGTNPNNMLVISPK